MVRDAFAAGVSAMVSIGTRLDKMAEPLRLAEKFPSGVFCAAGVHPLESADSDEGETLVTKLQEFASDPRVIGLGESGLDYFKSDHPPKAKQRRVFESHIAAAEVCGLPLVVHNRNADEETLEMLKGIRTAAVMHCFCADEAMMTKIMEQGLYVSLGGIITYKNAEHVRRAAALAAPDKVLLETDAPFLAPHPHRGKQNEPALVTHVAETLAQCMKMEVEELERLTDANFRRAFPKAFFKTAAGNENR